MWCARTLRRTRSLHTSAKVCAEENIFAKYSAMANEYGAVNLGQGFPSFETPPFVIEAGEEAIKEGHNQYIRPGGSPRLCGVLSEHYSPLFGREIDPMTEIVSCNGAQLGFYQILSAFCQPGDEILCLEPCFDSPWKIADHIGAVRKGVSLRPRNGVSAASAADLVLDLGELEAAICDRRTRFLVLNTPHNPTGKVFSRDELEGIASIVERHPGLIVISDEVYEYSVFGGAEHVRFASLPGMWDRTVSLYSAGKTFSCTGWRVGYSIGPAHLVQPMIHAQSVISFCVASPLEMAVATAMEAAATNGYFVEYPKMLERKAVFLEEALAGAGLDVVKPQGGYFCMANSDVVVASAGYSAGVGAGGASGGAAADVLASEYMTKEVGVCCLPTSAFYTSDTTGAGKLLRFCFVKTDEELAEAAHRLKAADFTV